MAFYFLLIITSNQHTQLNSTKYYNTHSISTCVSINLKSSKNIQYLLERLIVNKEVKTKKKFNTKKKPYSGLEPEVFSFSPVTNKIFNDSRRETR